MQAQHARLIWLGHASALVDLFGDRVLIDPLGRRRARAAAPYHAVLITHAHVDHLNRWTLAGLDKDVTLYVPMGARAVVQDLGFREVIEVEPGMSFAIRGMDVIGVPTRHDSGRWRRGDMPICIGYVLAKNGVLVHHAGDVDMSDYQVFDRIGGEFSLDATLLPIGGMLPVWYYRMRRRALDRGVHIDPDTALHIAERLGARAMVPIHWGTVHLRLGLPSMPRRRLVAVAGARELSDLVRVLDHGDSLDLARPDDSR